MLSPRMWIVSAAILASLGATEPALAQGSRLKVSETQTGIFGVQGKGTKFVYVMDRSASMGEFKGRPLAAAKRELIASLETLDSVHQFQVIFYNQELSVVNTRQGGAARLLFGSDTDRATAVEFIRAIRPSGGSEHLGALKAGLRIKPDVLFFLTDAGEPLLTSDDLKAVTKLNESIGAQIFTIEFGIGKDPGDSNVLRAIAERNRGEYVYVDVTTLKD